MTGHDSVPPVWALWRNPVLLRCWRSRMRIRVFLAWATVVLIGCGFAVSLVYQIAEGRLGAEPWEGARLAFFPLLVAQIILLQIVGTGAVASGLVQESVEGMLDYQRLSPLPVVHKLVGYLFGLPAREYALFGLTLPFLGWAVVVGELPVPSVLRVYFVLGTSTLVYHMTAMVGGLAFTRKWFVVRSVQIGVVLLYVALPQLSNLGYVLFEHLTVRPVFGEELGGLVREAGGRFTGGDERPERILVGFFGLSLPQFVFSILIQTGLLGVFANIVGRKWGDPSRHAFGRLPGLLFYGGVVMVMLGNLLPLVGDGRVFPSRVLGAVARQRLGAIPSQVVGDVTASEAGFLVGLFALLLTLLAGVLVRGGAPLLDEAVRGLRRARRMGRRGPGWWSDAAPSWWWAGLLGGVAGAAVWWFGWEVGVSAWMMGKPFPWDSLPLVAGVPVMAAVGAAMAHEVGGARGGFLLGVAGWLVPALGMLLLAGAGDATVWVALYVGACSPLTAPFCGMVAADADWADAALHAGPAFTFGLGVQSGVLLLLVWLYLRHRRWLRGRVGED